MSLTFKFEPLFILFFYNIKGLVGISFDVLFYFINQFYTYL